MKLTFFQKKALKKPGQQEKTSWFLTLYHSKILDIFVSLKKVRPLLRIPNLPWPGDIQRGIYTLDRYGKYVHPKMTPDFWWQDIVQDDAYFTTFEFLRDLRSVGDNKSRRFARYMIQSWIVYQRKMPKHLRSPKLSALRLANALGMYEFYAQSADDRFLNILHKFLFRECVKLRWLPSKMSPSFDTVCVLKGAILSSLAYEESRRKTAALLSRLTKVLTQILFSDGFNKEGRVDIQFRLACDLIEIRNFLRICQDPGAADKIQHFIEKVTPPLRLLRHGDGKLSFLSGMDIASTHHIDAVLSLSEARARGPQRSEHAGFERMLLNNSMILMKTKPSTFLSQSTGNLYFEWSIGKERIITSSDIILETDKKKPILSRHQSLVSKYSEKDHAYLECELQDTRYRHMRQLYLTEEVDLRGSDRVMSMDPGFCALRFVVHPDFKVEPHPSKKAVILTSKKGDRHTVTFSGVDGVTTDYINAFGARHPVIFALIQLFPQREMEIKWSFRGA